jgi:hypothetical protein
VKPQSDSDAVEAARLRAAHDLLDERPSSKVRAAVLRAAGRGPGVDAAAGSPHAPATRRRRWSGWAPLAAAGATAAVGVLAIGVSLHVERERPVAQKLESPPAAAMSPPAAAAAPAAPTRKAAPALAAPPAPTRDAAPAPAALAAAPRAPAATAARMSPSVQNVAPAAADAGAPPLPEGASEQRARSSRAQAAVVSPDDWLRRIVELRRAGREAEADRELARFRAAFPSAKVPPEAAGSH